METELKTLKDFESNNESVVLLMEVRTEAIKWIKEFEKRKIKMCAFDFKRFHNIT